MPIKIDAHQHFWELRPPFDHSWLDADSPIRRNYLPNDLRPLIDGVGVDRTIFVQTQHTLAENEWVLKLADEHDFIAVSAHKLGGPIGIGAWIMSAAIACSAVLSAAVQLSTLSRLAVSTFLGSHGIEPERISSEGRGEAQPIASNDSPEGRANNRRVEIIVQHEEDRPATTK